jgi:hypothetical protein
MIFERYVTLPLSCAPGVVCAAVATRRADHAVMAFAGAHIIGSTGAAPLERATVLVRDGGSEAITSMRRIESVWIAGRQVPPRDRN